MRLERIGDRRARREFALRIPEAAEAAAKLSVALERLQTGGFLAVARFEPADLGGGMVGAYIVADIEPVTQPRTVQRPGRARGWSLASALTHH